jgi:hypothetical protein
MCSCMRADAHTDRQTVREWVGGLGLCTVFGQILYTRGGAEHGALALKYLCHAVEVAEPNAHLLWGLLTVRNNTNSETV